jgi:hypothetical protein
MMKREGFFGKSPSSSLPGKKEKRKRKKETVLGTSPTTNYQLPTSYS